MSSFTADLLWKLWYPLLTRLTRRSRIIFLNYGYAESDSTVPSPTLATDDEPDRPCIQLYDAVVRPVSLHRRDVLEVSCGHGGGASYIARYHHPKSTHGVDRNARAIGLCSQRYNIPGLTFSRGDALSLDFADQSFDAVVNVEASHCYPDMPRFLHEVARVLRPGGYFLYADFRQKDPASEILNRQLEESELEIIDREDISPNVVGGMQLNTRKYLEWIRQYVPAFLHKPARHFAGVEGSTIFNELKSGETVYLRYVLRKLPRSDANPGL